MGGNFTHAVCLLLLMCLATAPDVNAQKAAADTLQLPTGNIVLPADTSAVDTVQKVSAPFFIRLFQRQLLIQETFLFTDATKGNIFRISSERVSKHITTEWDFAFDYLRNESETKRKRFTFNQKTEFFHLPFVAMDYFKDPVVNLANLSVRGGLTHTVIGGFRLDYGYGFKWDNNSEAAVKARKKDKFDVWSVKIQNKKKFGRVTFSERFSTVVPRQVSESLERQPVYDLRSSLGVSLLENLDAVIRFDWRYEKLNGRPKEDWVNYTVTFGITSLIGKKFGKDAAKKKSKK